MLHAISEHVFKSPDLSAILDGILDKALALGYFDIGVIRLSEPGNTEIRVVALRGYRHPELLRNQIIDLANPGPGGIYSRVVRNKEVKVIEDVSSLPGFSVFKEEGVQSAILAPILAGQELLGTILLGSRIPRKFPPELIGTLEALSNHMGIAIQKARLHEETRTSLDRIRALREIETAITSTLDLQSVLDMLLEKVELFLPVAVASTVRLHNPATGTLEALASRGRTQEILTLGGRSTAIVETQAPPAALNTHKAPRILNPSQYAGLVLSVPLIAHKKVLGVLSIFSRVEHELSKAEIEFLETLAGQAAIAIDNARLFEQISKQARDLESANKVKDEFLAVMSHELRTPLSITMGYVGMMKEGLLGEITPEQEDALQKVLNQSDVQLRMVNDIMETTYFESRTVAIERQLVNLSDFFRHLKLDFDAIREKDQAALGWEYPQDPLPIVTDSRKLRQIVQNLISNAIKFTDQGKVTVSVKTVSRSPNLPLFDSERNGKNGDDQWLEIKVRDTGRGIPGDKLDAIFDKFYQLDTSETRLCGGLGLGLYITKKFTELLGGKITVESEISEGSTFTVTIPYVS
jgi:signal transduction histidine kinase